MRIRSRAHPLARFPVPALALALALALAACSAPPTPPAAAGAGAASASSAAAHASTAPATAPAQATSPRVTITGPSGRAATVRVELARTAAEQERGLMFRRVLGADEGMLFLFRDTSEHVFWMKDTPLPLDLVFIDAAGVVVGVLERAEPMTTTIRTIGRKSRSVLEVNAGWIAAHGVAAGDRVTWHGFQP